MVKRLRILGVFAIMLLSAPAWAAEDIPLKVGIACDYPPFSYLNEYGERVGFDVDMARALCEAMGRRCEFVCRPFAGLLEQMRQGKLDLLMGMSDTAEWRSSMDLSTPYLWVRFLFVGRPGVPDAEAESAMRVGVRAGTARMEGIENFWAGQMQVVRGEFGKLLNMLCAGDLDMILTNDLAGYSFLLSERGQEFEVLGTPLSQETFPGDVRVGVRKGAGKLCGDVNLAIKNTRFDGTFGRINRDHFPYAPY